MTKTLLIVLLSFPLTITAGNVETLTQTKSKLQHLETEINSLQHTLNTAQDKNHLLNQELALTEKKISMGVHQSRLTQQDMDRRQHKITQSQHQIDTLNAQLDTQRQLLAKHIRARYMMGEYQPLKWLLNQDNPYKTSRILTFYAYMLKSRQHVIADILETKQKLTESYESLQLEMNETQRLQQQLLQHQQKLEKNKQYGMAILQVLNKTIQSQQQSLKEHQQNKETLSNLLKTLSQQSTLQPRHPLVFQHKKLPRPVQGNDSPLKKLNQGIVFFANEGTPVTAIYPGKVVFSDWLKGYGLLLIVDHGQGFMSLYAHNQSLYKQKGESVQQGEAIAAVGHSGGLKQNGLYFEIRERGKAISPLNWLS
ncbi:MAG: peptidoglycan DD-metalloendopeptidase family protein [Legionellales bacterium]|nr:peptidoglycan DD-metalloendopeptidase family protein [Legionellales bacterium]